MLSSALAIPQANIVDTFNGLPTHALLVHFTVVVGTVAATAGLAYALVPRFRNWLSLPIAAIGAACIILGLITPASGEKLEARVDASPLLEKHTELGDQMGIILIAFGFILILTTLVARYRGSATTDDAVAPTAMDRIGGIPGRPARAFGAQPQVAALLTVLVLAGSVVSGIWIYRTGDAGAASVWDDLPASVQK